jgi:protein-tyrosine phosphatase
MPSVLFVCTANQFRSPLAAACFSKHIEREALDTKWKVESAGTWTENGMHAAGIASRVARSLDLGGLESHLTRQVERDLLEQFDLVILMEAGHKEALYSEFPAARQRLYLLSELVEGIPYDIPDPADPGVDPFDVGREICSLIAKGEKKILRLAESLCRD